MAGSPAVRCSRHRRLGFNSVELFFSWQTSNPPPTVDPDTGKLVHHYDPLYLAALDDTRPKLPSPGLAVVLVMMQSRWSGAFQNITSEWQTATCGVGMPAWIYERDGTPAGGGLEIVRAEVGFFQDRAKVWSDTGLVSEPMRQSFIKAWRVVAAGTGRTRRSWKRFRCSSPMTS